MFEWGVSFECFVAEFSIESHQEDQIAKLSDFYPIVTQFLATGNATWPHSISSKN
jgi:hypothetical protein